ncbi:hypothetical protein scyTo_0020593 [Scyliorhinus torazame]|uniref:Uncharacterized protein n=1 Tax=Scyliorhinus torazame TaxID=75743 RepID=A0A401PX42_SCYTO|nr:hypothetical protein [Scyliorhinus torazame]
MKTRREWVDTEMKIRRERVDTEMKIRRERVDTEMKTQRERKPSSRDKQFLVFFFKQLRKNSTGRYQEFPYVSLCGRERNFVRCDDLPIVFTHLIKGEGSEEELLSYCGGGDKLAVRFEPERLFMPENGRVYHPASERSGSVGLVKSSLAFELSPHFEYLASSPESDPPSHFHWNGKRFRLTNELSSLIQTEEPT